MTALLWPAAELPARTVQIDPVYRNLRGPASGDGLSQVGSSDAGLWAATMTSFIVHQQNEKRRIELWHAINGLLEGRLNPVIVPVYVSGRRPLPDGVTDKDIDGERGTPHSDETFFDDDTGYETLWIDAPLGADAARRATEITLTKAVCGEIAPGMRFSIDPMDADDRPIRLYQAKRIVSQDDGAATIKIWPPLREALDEGQAFEWARPYVQMRLASDGEMNLTMTPADLTDFPSVSFIEDL